MSDKLTRLLELFYTLQDYSVLPEISAEMNRNDKIDLLPILRTKFAEKLASIAPLSHQNSSKTKRTVAAYQQHINVFYTSLFFNRTILYPIEIIPSSSKESDLIIATSRKYEFSKPLAFRSFTSNYRDPEFSHLILHKSKDQIGYPLPINHSSIYPMINHVDDLLPIFTTAYKHVIKDKYFTEGHIFSFFNGKAIIKFRYPEKLWDFHIPHDDFFCYLFRGVIRIKGIDHARFKPSDKPIYS